MWGFCAWVIKRRETKTEENATVEVFFRFHIEVLVNEFSGSGTSTGAQKVDLRGKYFIYRTYREQIF